MTDVNRIISPVVGRVHRLGEKNGHHRGNNYRSGIVLGSWDMQE